MWCDLLLALALPPVSRCMALWLSCKRTLPTALQACSSKKQHVHGMGPITSSTPTTLASVKLHAFTFCLADTFMIAPLPIMRAPPVWPWKSSWTANEEPALQIKMCDPSALSVSQSSGVCLRNLMSQTNLSQLNLVGSFVHVHRCTVGCRTSGLPLLHRNRLLRMKE